MTNRPAGSHASPPGRGWTAVLLGVGIGGIAVAFVAFSLTRPEPETYLPSPVLAGPPPEPLTGPQLRTVDASDPEVWRHFSFERGSVVENPAPDEWDLAFRRFQVIVNGGDGFVGEGGAVLLEGVPFESPGAPPASGYVPTEVRSDSVNPVMQRWYDYSFFSHLLTPRPAVYAVRAADGRVVHLEFLGYYCPGPLPGCVTFRYAWASSGLSHAF